MIKILLYLFFILFLFTSCTQNETKELKISTNSWIGYTPLFYAQKKGYLKDINIKLITNVSLAESTAFYDVGKVDMLTATQHEYYSLKNTGHDLIPIILLDRSNGGDMVLSNKNITQIKKAKKIYTYLEIDSINAEIIEDFIKFHQLDKKNMEFINKDQAQIQDLRASKNKTLLVVTYSPYDITLKKHGFHVVASTKNMHSILVIDALYAKNKLLKTHKKRLQDLKNIIDISITEIQNNPHSSYKLVKSFLGDISYNEYVESLKLISWINKPSHKLLERIKSMGYDENRLIQ